MFTSTEVLFSKVDALSSGRQFNPHILITLGWGYAICTNGLGQAFIRMQQMSLDLNEKVRDGIADKRHTMTC